MMYYIGTSLGRCIRSIMAGEVSVDQVLVIITGTMAPTHEHYTNVVKEYHASGAYSMPSGYDTSSWPLDDVLHVANSLWYNGKIHQPRVTQDDMYEPLAGNPSITGQVWIEVLLPQQLLDPAVQDLWSKTKMLATLTNADH